MSGNSLENSINTEEIDNKVKKAILEITSGIREKLDQFTNDLNLKDMKDIPLKVCNFNMLSIYLLYIFYLLLNK